MNPNFCFWLSVSLVFIVDLTSSQQSDNQQQVVLPIKKINLATFGLNLKNDKKPYDLPKVKNINKNYEESSISRYSSSWTEENRRTGSRIHKIELEKENLEHRRRLMDEHLGSLRNSLRELDWEYAFDHGRGVYHPSTIRSGPRSTTSTTTTTTTTTTTPRPSYKIDMKGRTGSYHHHHTKYYTTDRTTPIYSETKKGQPPSTRSPSLTTESFPIRDCQQECVPKHFLVHYYERKHCRPMFSRDCNCVKYFICPNDEFHKKTLKSSSTNQSETEKQWKQVDDDDDHCILNQTQYRIGHIIPIPNEPCSVCRCVRDEISSYSSKLRAKVDCSKVVDCPELAFGIRPTRPECYFAYSHDRCCGVEVCTDRLKWDDDRLRKCRYQNRTYRYGEQIALLDNHCKRCICNQHWNEFDPESSPESCTDIMCPIVASRSGQNCLPIYDKNQCCPVDYICQQRQNITTIETKNAHSDWIYRKYMKNIKYEERTDDEPPKYHCWMYGKRYHLGQTIHVSKDSMLHKNMCATCQCKIPPLMTCMANRQCLIRDNVATF